MLYKEILKVYVSVCVREDMCVEMECMDGVIGLSLLWSVYV